MTAPFTIAVDVGGSHISVALVGDQGVVGQRRFSVDPRLGLGPCLPRIEQVIAELRTNSSLCSGIAMAVPMLIDPASGRVISSPKGKYEDASGIDFRGWAQARLGLNLLLEVDAHAGCLGEWVFGAGQGCEDMVFVILGTGYGSSVVIRNRLLRGRTGQAGILGGHLAVNGGGHQCVCPANGCIEAETGSWAIDAIVREQAGFAASRLSTFDKIDYSHLFRLASEGDGLAEAMLVRSLNLWGASLVNLTHAYNPARIVMAGGIIKAADRIVPFMNDYLRKSVWTASGYPEVVSGEHPDTAVLLGLRALSTRQFETL